MINRLLHKEYFWIYFISLLFIITNSFFIAFDFYYFLAFPLLLIFLWIAFKSLRKFFLITVFFVPLSIPLSFLLQKTGFDLSLPAEPFLILILILMVLKYLKRQVPDRRILFHPVSLAISFYLAWTLMTSITSTIPLVSFKFFTARLWFIIGFYFLATQIFQKKKYFERYLWAYIIPLIAIIGYVLIRHSSYGLNNQQVAYFVVKPFYNDHTSYGAVIAMILPVLAGLFLIKIKKTANWQKFLFLLLFLLLLVAVGFSYTRAAWLSLFVILVIWIIIRLRVNKIFVIAGLVLLCFIGFLYRSEIVIFIEKNDQTSSGKFNEHIQSIVNIRNDDSNLERLNRWGCAWRMFKEKPFFGWGPGTYMFNYAPFQISGEKTNISTNAGTGGNAHSEYLGSLSESGIFGVLSYSLVIILTIITGMRIYFKSEKRKIRILSLAILLGLITYYIHGFLNNFLDTDKFSVLFWGFTAMLVAVDIYHIGEKRNTQIPEN